MKSETIGGVHVGVIERAWESLSAAIMPDDVPPIQRREMRRAFFCGAMALWRLFMESSLLDDGTEETNRDLVQMELIDQELQTFGQMLQRGQA